MKKRRVIHAGNLPATLPINRTIVLLIALDYWKVSLFWFDICVLYLFIHWALAILAWLTEDETDISKSILYDAPYE